VWAIGYCRWLFCQRGNLGMHSVGCLAILIVVHSADLGLALSAAETWCVWRLRCAFYKLSVEL